MSEPLALARETVALNRGEVALLRFGAKGAPPLLFAHANGFCALAYRKMLSALGDRFDVFAVDLRGHGHTRLPASPEGHRSMDIFGEDMAALLDLISPRIGRGWTLAGHSLGAVAVTLAAARRGDVAGLRLIEPVATPPWWRLLARGPLWRSFAAQIRLVRAANSRRSEWPDRDSVKASYAKKPLFSTWADGVLDDYLEDGLEDAGAGVRLSCAPSWEAATFAAHAHDFWAAIGRAPGPVAVLAADHASTTVSSSAALRFEKRGATLARIDGATHLLPFEDPKLAARFIAGDLCT